MVTRNVNDLADSFESIVQDRDITGAAVISLAGAAGGVISQQIANQVLPLIGMSARPTNTTGLAASGVTKILVGALHGYLGLEVGGTAGMALVVAGVGAVILGGGDLISAGLSATEGGVTAGLGNGRRVSARPVSRSRNTSNGRSNQSRSTSPSNGGTAASAGM